MAAADLLPLFLKLGGRKVVLVGGGRVAAAKLPALLAAGADVTVVAPRIDPAIAAAGVTLAARAFVPGDLDGAWLAIAAATPVVNADVAAAAEARRVFVNAVDDPARASAYAGGIVRRGGVVIAISTGGDAPALAGLLREGLDTLLPEELDAWLAEARALRADWKGESVPHGERRRRLLDALNRLYARDDVHRGTAGGGAR